MKSLLCIAAVAGALLMPTLASAQTAQKSLVAYYSWSGNTRYAAEIIAKATNSDLFEIVPEKAYPTDMKACIDQAKEEINNKVRPAIKGLPKDLAKYQKIYIGSPNWWGTMAPPVATFIEKCGSFKDKTVLPFLTHGTGGLQNYEKDITEMINAKDGKVWPAVHWNGTEVKDLAEEIRQWAATTK